MKKLKQILAFVITIVLTITIFPITASAASTKSQLQADIAKWEKEIDNILAQGDVLYIDDAQVWSTSPQVVVFIINERHPFKLEYWHGYYFKGLSYDDLKMFVEGNSCSLYIRLVQGSVKYANTALGSVPCYACTIADDVYSLKEKISDAKAKLQFTNAKLTCNTSNLNIVYCDKSSQFYSYMNNLPSGYVADESNRFDVTYNLSGVDLYSNELFSIAYNDNEISKYITWKSSNSKIANISSIDYFHNTLTLDVKKTGNCTITGKVYGSNKSVKINISVKRCPTGISITPRSSTLEVGSTLKLDYKINPKNSVKEIIHWISSDPSVAYVSASGTVKAKGAGTAYIFAYTNSGLVSLSCKIKVNGTLEESKTVESFTDAITAIKLSPYITTDKNKKYMYDSEEYELVLQNDGNTYYDFCYHVTRCSPISEAIKYRYTNASSNENGYWKYTAENFYVFSDGVIIYEDADGSLFFATDYFTDDESQTAHDKYVKWLQDNEIMVEE